MKIRFVTAGILVLFGVESGTMAASADRPNIVFILADDLRAGVLGCEGNTVIRTPNLDALARDGIYFNKAFVTTSICMVSRASILTGQYASRHGIKEFSQPFTNEQWQETYPVLLRKAGYYTGLVGKVGVGDAKAVAASKDRFDYWNGKAGQGGPFIDPKDPTHTHSTAKFGSMAVHFIETAPADKPFNLSVSFSAPHARDGKPREFEPDLRDEPLYRDSQVTVPLTATDKYFKMLPEEARKSEGRKRWKARFADPGMFQKTVRDYMRLVTGIDREVGHIRQALDKRGLTTNTVIIFGSDNGFFYGERGLADKWLMYEGSIRVPLIIYDPLSKDRRVTPTVSQLVLNIDIAPTMLDMAGVNVPRAMQGRSLLPLIRGNNPTGWRKDFFYEHHFGENRKPPIPATEGVRGERWKYIRWTSVSPAFEELFDLQTDPDETINLAGDRGHVQKLEELRARWAELSEQVR